MSTQFYFKKLVDYLRNIDQNIGSDIPLQGGGFFNAKPIYHPDYQTVLIGVNVTNLDNQPFLPLSVFSATIELLLQQKDFRAAKGYAQAGRLGSNSNPLDSVEGYVAHSVYGVNVGTYAFRRITPISRILEAADICDNEGGYLSLKNSSPRPKYCSP